MRTDGDYISRNAALRLIEQYCGEAAHAGYYDAAVRFGSVYREVEDFPAADVRPVVKSKWADNHVSFYRGCPECGAFVRANLDEVFLRDFPSAVGKLNFCPNCGCAMEES